MLKKVIITISVILVVLLGTTGVLYAADNSNIKTFKVTSSSNKGGTITPNGKQDVQKDGSITFNISIDSGYELAWLRVDKTKVDSFTGSSYTFDKVTKNHTIQAHFSKIKTFKVTSSSNKGGTITPKGKQSVLKGGSITFNISIDSGYELAWLRVDKVKVNSFTGSSYTFNNVTKNHTIQAHFSKTS